MGKRRRSREAALQLLYATQICNTDVHHAATLAGGMEGEDVHAQDDFSQRLLVLVEDNEAAVDGALAKALRNWAAERLAAPDRAILRLGTAELLFCDDIPHRVTINEYIELARKYGDADSPRFINGVLDRVWRDKEESRGTP